MDPSTVILLALLMAAAAALYSSVGHGGASAYLGLMALFAVPIEVMRPTALALCLVQCIGQALRCLARVVVKVGADEDRGRGRL